MPKIPWMMPDRVDQDQFLVFASRFEVASVRWSFRFIVGTIRLLRQMRTAEGCVGMSLDADLLRGVFCTVSVWKDQAHLAKWSAQQPHRKIAASLAPSMRSATLTSWTESSSSLPLNWQDVHARLIETKNRNEARSSAPNGTDTGSSKGAS